MTRKGNWFQTYTGRRFYPMDPRPEDFHLRDIAHALANVNRYGGHLGRPYSVAQHSVLVSQHCPPGFELVGLMHDAPEAYIGDMVKPLKLMLPQFQEIEDGIWRALAERYDLPAEMPDEVKTVDLQMLGTEARDMIDKPLGDWHLDLGVDLLPKTITPWDWQRAEVEFMYRFTELRYPDPFAPRPDEATPEVERLKPEHCIGGNDNSACACACCCGRCDCFTRPVETPTPTEDK